MHNAITDVPSIKVGQVAHTSGMTGVTVILVEQGAICAADVRGSNPGTLHTDAMDPLMANRSVQAVCFAGGSLWGLAAAFGVMRYLEERGLGVETRAARIPVVPAAVVYDLTVGDPKARPSPEEGYRAARTACPGPVRQGNVGAGTGATTGKGTRGIPLKAGVGTASVALPGGVVVGALAVVNSVGDVVHPSTGELYATHGGFDSVPPLPELGTGLGGSPSLEGENTTLGVVATNARLDKTQLRKVAQVAHNALARAIRPIHTTRDGDTIFALAVQEGAAKAPGIWWGEAVDIVATAAEDALLRAVVAALLHAESVPGFPSYKDWRASRQTGGAIPNDTG
ncbi:MAG: P1 family peptidase [Armatimonadetes bacterium]|nr:P1 family peptidase [Armatimonadota bacterium]